MTSAHYSNKKGCEPISSRFNMELFRENLLLMLVDSTQAQLSETIGFSSTVILHILSGKHRPSGAFIMSVCQTQGFPLSYYLNKEMKFEEINTKAVA